MRKRHGKNEKRVFDKLRRKIKNFYFTDKETRRETRFNAALGSMLKQEFKERLVDKHLDKITLVGEEFHPDLQVGGEIAVEVKFLTEEFHKAKFKEGLAQALVYRSYHKFVILVLVDLTKNRSYHQADGRTDKNWNQLIKRMQLQHIAVEVIIPKK